MKIEPPSKLNRPRRLFEPPLPFSARSNSFSFITAEPGTRTSFYFIIENKLIGRIKRCIARSLINKKGGIARKMVVMDFLNFVFQIYITKI